MGLRRSGREAAVKILYAMEFTKKETEAAAKDYWSERKVTPKLKEYTMSLVRGTFQKQSEIDETIKEASVNWNMDRMPEVDRNILRLAVYELIECNEVPTAVVINEAVELAKRYSGSESASFINGILGKIQEMRKK